MSSSISNPIMISSLSFIRVHETFCPYIVLRFLVGGYIKSWRSLGREVGKVYVLYVFRNIQVCFFRRWVRPRFTVFCLRTGLEAGLVANGIINIIFGCYLHIFSQSPTFPTIVSILNSLIDRFTKLAIFKQHKKLFLKCPIF